MAGTGPRISAVQRANHYTTARPQDSGWWTGQDPTLTSARCQLSLGPGKATAVFKF